MAALFSNRISGMEHSFLMKGEDGIWKCLSTTVNDPDEAGFIQNLAGLELQDIVRDYFFFSKMRKGIRSHIVFPLTVRKNEAIGAWVMENERKDKLPVEKEYLKLAQLITLFIQLHYDERICTYNYYLDPMTNLPGRDYFKQVAERVKKCECRALLCILRYENSRESIRFYGNTDFENKMKRLAKEIIDMKLGNGYCLSADTFAVITVDSEQEAYAKMKFLFHQNGMWGELKGTIMGIKPHMDILTEIEDLLSICSPGVIRIQERDRRGPLAPLFEAKTNGKPEEIRSKEPDAQEGDTEEEILRLLDGRGIL